MTPEDLKQFWPTQKDIAKAFSVAQSSVSEWFTKGRLPKGRQYEAHFRSGGVLVVDEAAREDAE